MIGQLRSHETNRRRVSDNNNVSQLLRDSFSVSQQPPIWEPPVHYSMGLAVQSPLSSVDSCAHTSVSPGHNTSVETLECRVVHVRGPHYEQRNTTYSNPPMNFRELKDSAIDWISFSTTFWEIKDWIDHRRVLKCLSNCKLQSKGKCKCLLVQAEFQLKTFIYMTNINSSIISHQSGPSPLLQTQSGSGSNWAQLKQGISTKYFSCSCPKWEQRKRHIRGLNFEY